MPDCGVIEIQRVCSKAVPMPVAPSLQKVVVVTEEEIVSACL